MKKISHREHAVSRVLGPHSPDMCGHSVPGTEERRQGEEGKMELRSYEYKSKSPSETQMQTSGAGRDGGGRKGENEEKRGRAAGEVIITSQPHSSV